ncbi:MAG TPA: hypothetical protein PLG21_23175 [Anaerolineae bacterium]|nr:hypothetical protein [Anaerolineae bacterium]
MSYATIAELRAYLPQIKVDSTNDALLATVLERAHEIVNDALGFEFTAWGATVTTRDVECRHEGRWLEVPYHKPASITLVKSLSGRGTTYEALTDESDWLEEADGRLYRGGGWGLGTWYRISALWGYGSPPASIVEVEIEIAVNIWRGRDASSWQSDVGTDGQGAVGFNRALTWAQRSIIDGVRQRVLGVVHA